MKCYSKSIILFSMFVRMLTIFLPVNSVWIVTSSSSLLVYSIQNCQVKVLFLASSYTVHVVCLVSFWQKPEVTEVYWPDLVFRLYFDISGRGVFTGCLLSLSQRYYLSWTLLLVVECQLILINVWILNFSLSSDILVIPCVYKCWKYGSFSPTLVYYFKIQEWPNCRRSLTA